MRTKRDFWKGVRLISALVMILLPVARSQGASQNQMRVQVDGKDYGSHPYVVSRGVLFVPLTLFSSIGWKPLLDPFNKTIDLADCIRINTTGNAAYLIGGPVGIGVAVTAKLSPLSSSVMNYRGSYYLPAKSVVNYLQYGISFESSARILKLSRPSDPNKINPTQESCLNNISDS